MALIDPGYWDETTPFILFEGPASIDNMGKKVVAGLDADLDTVVIPRVSNATTRYWGVVIAPLSLGGYVANISRLR